MAKTRFLVSLVVVCLALFLAGRAAAENVDLRDPAQYDAFVARLRAAGVTAENHAALFEHLAKAKTAAPGAKLKPSPLKMANVIVDLATDDGDHFSVTGLSTVPGGTDYTMLTLQLYNQDDVPIGPPASAEQLDKGTFAFLATNGTLSSVPDSKSVRAILTAFVEPKGGHGMAETVMAEGGTLPDKLTNENPRRRLTNVIRVCVGKQGRACDYFSKVTTKFPVQGSVVFGQPIDRIRYDRKGNPINATLTLLLADATNGGGCAPLSAGSFFKNHVKITGKTLRWSVDPASFGACYPTDARFVLAIGMKVKGAPALVSVADVETPETRTTVAIPPMSVIR